MNPDKPGTDTGTGAPVTVAEIAEILRQLRILSRSSVAADTGLARDTTAERAAFLARKADLLVRIAAQYPDLAPPTTAPSTTGLDGGPA